MKLFTLSLSFLLFFMTWFAFSELFKGSPCRELKQNYLGKSVDAFNSVAISPDGKVWVAGFTESSSGNKGKSDASLICIDPIKNHGNQIVYSQSFGGSGYDYFCSVTVASDGKVWAVGRSDSNDGDIQNSKGDSDGWLICINPTNMDTNRGITYSRTFGGRGKDELNSLAIASDGKIWAAGYSDSADGELSGNKGKGGIDGWLICVDPTDVDNSRPLIYSRAFGGGGKDELNSLAIAPDGKIWAAGYSNSNDGDMTGNIGSKGLPDGWIICITPEIADLQNSKLIYSQNFGGTSNDLFTSIAIAPDGKVWTAGYSDSEDAAPLFNNNGGSDGWLLCIDPKKIKSNYGVVYSKNLGTTSDNLLNAIAISPDGKVWAAGDSRKEGRESGWLICLEPDNNNLQESQIVYSKTATQGGSDHLHSMAISANGRIWAAGGSHFLTGSGKASYFDGWIFSIFVRMD